MAKKMKTPNQLAQEIYDKWFNGSIQKEYLVLILSEMIRADRESVREAMMRVYYLMVKSDSIDTVQYANALAKEISVLNLTGEEE